MWAAWLADVHSELEDRGAIFDEYGVSEIGHLSLLDHDDVSVILVEFKKAGAKALPLKLLKRALDAARPIPASPAAGSSAPAAKKPGPKAPSSGGGGPKGAPKTKIAKEHKSRSRVPASADSEGSDSVNGLDQNDASTQNDEQSAQEQPGTRKCKSNVTQRPRNRAGSKKQGAAYSAVIEGRGRLQSMFDKSPSASNLRGMGGQADAASAEAGMARPFAGIDARRKGMVCQKVCMVREGDAVDTCHCLADATER
jgi:hypothetical protein